MTAIESGELGRAAAPAVRSGGRRRLWPWLLAVAVIGVGFGALRARGLGAAPEAGRSKTAQRSVPVQTSTARTGDVPVYLRGLGTATALQTAVIRSRVDGQLVSVAFREGQHVGEGELLAQIDPRPFEVQIEQAEGQLARDQAALRDANLNLERNQELFAQGILPQQQLDSQRAQVDQLAGAVRSDEAQVHSARLQLSYSRITAPFSGRVGLRLLDAGNMVHANDPGGLLVLTQVHPIAVVFSLPQDDLSQVMKKLATGARLEVEAFDRDNSRQIASGALLGIDNQIDPTTGTYKLKAVFGNEDDALFPNQFVNVRLHLDTRRGLVLVPSAALQRGPQGAFVYVVGADGLAKVRPVTAALSEGSDTALSDGLAAGESVVVDGQDKLRDGSQVEIAGKGGNAGQGAEAKTEGAGESKGKRGRR